MSKVKKGETSIESWNGIFADPVVGRVLRFKGLIANHLTSTVEELGRITSLSGVFHYHNGITKFPELKYCTRLTDMSSTFSESSLVEAPIIPESVTNMYMTFDECSSLVEAPIIPESVTTMNYTFYGCTKLVEAPIIPESVTTMDSTFKGCTKLNGIYVIKPLTPPTYNTSLTNVVSIYVPDESVDLYKAASGWKEFASKIYPLSTKP